MRVWDNRKSKRRLVMRRIRIETSSGVKTSRLPFWSLSTRKVIESVKRRKQMTAVTSVTCWCASRYFGSNRQFRSIVESVVVAGAFCQRAFERLEPCAGKLASTVLRGERRSNTLLLPDWTAREQKDRLIFTIILS